MGNFDQKVNKFIEIFVEQNGYAKVIQGLQNTLLIAVTGLIIGLFDAKGLRIFQRRVSFNRVAQVH